MQGKPVTADLHSHHHRRLRADAWALADTPEKESSQGPGESRIRVARRIEMFLTLTVIFVVVSCTLLVTRINRKKDRDELQLHSITPEALHTLMASNPGTLLFDVRQPLDLLGHSAIIPGAKWIPPQELLKNP